MNRLQYLSKNDINKIEVELTSRCNAACPSCSRTDVDGKVIRSLPLTEISLNDFKRILPPDWVRDRIIKLCGVYGDPVVAKEFLPIVEYLVENEAKIVVNTNASMRPATFWTAFGRMLAARPGSECIFSIDGLEDTNAIYRRNTSWSLIMENARAFIAAGGYGHWDYLVFNHNEHQVEAAQQLAREMGFKKFTIKKTTRASDDKKPTPLELALNIKPSEKVEYLNSKLISHPSQMATSGDRMISGEQMSKRWWGKGLNFWSSSRSCNIACFSRGESASQVVKERSIYISAQLKVWPCCWWAGAEFPRSKDVRDLYRLYSEDFNSLSKSSLHEVLEHSWFKKHLVSSWYSEKRTAGVCSRNCNKVRPLNNEDCEDVAL